MGMGSCMYIVQDGNLSMYTLYRIGMGTFMCIAQDGNWFMYVHCTGWEWVHKQAGAGLCYDEYRREVNNGGNSGDITITYVETYLVFIYSHISIYVY